MPYGHSSLYHIFLRHIISDTSVFIFSRARKDHVSEPYITVSSHTYNTLFISSCRVVVFPFHNFSSTPHLFLPSSILWFTPSPIPPFALIIPSRYLDFSTIFYIFLIHSQFLKIRPLNLSEHQHHHSSASFCHTSFRFIYKMLKILS